MRRISRDIDRPEPWAESGFWASAAVGDHLEDHAGDRNPTNAELVTEVVQLCERLGRPVATPSQTISALGLAALETNQQI